MARKSTKAEYRSLELGDIDAALDRATFQVASKEAQENLRQPEFKRIVVAMDGSSGSRHVLEWAVALAKPFKAEVTVVSVAPSDASRQALIASAASWPGVLATFGEADEEAKTVLQHATRYLRDAGLKAKVELMHGMPANCIMNAALNENADLVILGSHGHGIAERVNLGGVGSSVKHNVACSVLIARGPPSVRRTLLATDGSQRARVSVQVGLQVAQALNVPAILAHVVDAKTFGLMGTNTSKLARLVQEQMAAHKSPVTKHLPLRIEQGPAAARLRKLATETKSDLIVVGSRGLGGLRSLTLGSVSDKLSNKADQSVLVVKPQAA